MGLSDPDKTLELVPNSCCVNSIAVYSELGTPKLIASDIGSYELLYRLLHIEKLYKFLTFCLNLQATKNGNLNPLILYCCDNHVLIMILL